MFNIESMSIDEILFAEAMTKGELIHYLGGFPGYYIQPQAADLPTEYDTAFMPISRRIMDEPQLQAQVLDAIKWLANDPEYGWGAIFHIGNLALLKKNQGLDLLTPDLLMSVADSLRRNKEAFMSLKRWIGKDFEDGVWAMVRNKNRLLHKKYEIAVLPEEL